jgi:hypothetical protein
MEGGSTGRYKEGATSTSGVSIGLVEMDLVGGSLFSQERGANERSGGVRTVTTIGFRGDKRHG